MTHPDPTEPTSADQPGRAGTGQFVVEPVQPERERRPIASTVAGAVVGVAVVALTAWGLVGRAIQPPPVARPAPPVAADASAPDGPTATPGMPVVDVATGEAALDQLAILAGWDGCPVWRAFDVGAPLAPREIEASVRATGVEHGPVDVVDAGGTAQRVWLGGDVFEAARGFGGTFVVREVDAAWTVVPAGDGEAAVRLKPTARRDGGTFWQVSGRAAPAPYCRDRTVQAEGPVRVVHASGDPLDALFEAAGFGRCLTWQTVSTQTLPSSAAIEAAAADELIVPDGQGWIDIPADATGGDRATKAWVGSSEPAAAAAHGSTLLVLGGDGRAAWLLVTLDGHPAAVELLRVETERGWTAWLPTRNAAGLTRSVEGPIAGCGG